MKKLVLAAALAVPALAFAKGNLKPGNWHIKVTHEFVGAPFTPPPTEIDQCITQQQADDPKQMAKGGNKDCEPADVKMEGNKLTFKVVCHSHGGTQTGTGEMVYAGDSYTGTTTVEMDNPKMGHVKMINHTTATRTGDCAK
jgi:Protein of unknown function (DUF3617)